MTLYGGYTENHGGYCQGCGKAASMCCCYALHGGGTGNHYYDDCGCPPCGPHQSYCPKNPYYNNPNNPYGGGCGGHEHDSCHERPAYPEPCFGRPGYGQPSYKPIHDYCGSCRQPASYCRCYLVVMPTPAQFYPSERCGSKPPKKGCL